ncbi:MAG: NERD domain-containing protein [Streptosporangiaceae bacterium]
MPQADPEVVGSPAPTPDESAGPAQPAEGLDATGPAEPESAEPGTGNTAESEHGPHDENGPVSEQPAQSEHGPASGHTPADGHKPEGEPRPAGEAERESALRAAAGNSAFRAAARLVWPGTEDRLAEPARAAEPAPDPAASGRNPADPAASGWDSPGPAASGWVAPDQPGSDQPAPGRPAADGRTADRPAAAPARSPRPFVPGVPSADYQGASYQAGPDIWEPRRLYKEPLLRPRRRTGPAPGGEPGQRPGRAAREKGQGPGQAGSSGQTAAPSRPPTDQPRTGRPETGQPGTLQPGPEAGADQRETRPGSDPPVTATAGGPPAATAPPVRLAITAGPDPAGSGGSVSPGSDDPERKAERLHLGDLMADSRMRIWKRRLLIALVAGLIFAFIFTWRAGLTAAVLAAIADAIYRSRTTASMPPGVRLTGAQKRTQRQLARMERSGYRALHSRPIPGSREFIDHFVVGPTGAYAIDSESWDKRLPIRTKNARQIWHGPFSKKDRLEHARWEAQQAAERLTAELGTPVYVRPVLAVYGPKVPWHFATIREVDVFDGDRLRKYLRRNATLKDRPKLTSGEVEQIYAAAARVLPLNDAAQHTPVG